VTIPDVIDEIADALWVIPRPTGFAKTIDGAKVYPIPPFTIDTDEIVPAIETTALAEAPTTFFWDTILILFCFVKFSLALSKKVFTLSTKMTVDATPTDCIILVFG